MASNNLLIRLGAQVSGALSGLKKVGGAVADLGKKAGALALKGVATALAGIAAAGAGVAAVGSKVLKLGANAETTRLAFQTMLGSVERGDAMMEKLDRFSNSTPYSGDQVNRAAKTLLGFGVAAGDVESTLRKVGDVAAGSGKDFNDLAAIYGKVFAKGKADSESLNQMVEAGIPIVKMLGEMYGKTGDEIYAMASQGRIGADDVSQAFEKMSAKGGVYAGMMEKQSKTMSGMWGAITGQLEYAGSMIGEAIAPLAKEVLGIFQGWADEIVEMCKDGRMVEYLATIAYAAVDVGARMAKAFLYAKEYGVAAFKAILDWGVGAWEAIAGSATIAFTATMKGLNWLWEQTKAVFTVIGRIFRMTFNGLVLVALEAFNGVLSACVAAINGIIKAANAVPGVDLDLVEDPAFLKKSKKLAEEFADSVVADASAIGSGKDFKDASSTSARYDRTWDATEAAANRKIDKAADLFLRGADRFSEAGKQAAAGSEKVDEFARKANDRIGKWQLDRLEEARKRKDAKLDDKGDDSRRRRAVGADAPGRREKSEVDRLAKIGLYTFGRGAIGNLDLERNKLLRQLIDTVGGQKTIVREV